MKPHKPGWLGEFLSGLVALSLGAAFHMASAVPVTSADTELEPVVAFSPSDDLAPVLVKDKPGRFVSSELSDDGSWFRVLENGEDVSGGGDDATS